MRELLEGTIGPYEPRELIGGGGVGIVYRAVHQTLRHSRAVKVLRPLVAEQDPSAVQRFVHEARIAATLRHPNIVTIYDVGEQDGRHFIVMELVEGTSLREFIRRQHPVPLDRALRLLRQLASALDHAHGRGVVHRDVKPENVLIGPDDRVVLVDFGIARASNQARITDAGQLVGTPAYMAPEVIAGGLIGPEADRYSLGVVAYELLTGRPPFDDPTTPQLLFAQANVVPPLPRLARPDLPRQVERALMRQLAKDPKRRFASAQQLVEALTRYAESMADRSGRGQVTALVAPAVAVQVDYPTPVTLLAVDAPGAIGPGSETWVNRAFGPMLVVLALLSVGIFLLDQTNALGQRAESPPIQARVRREPASTPASAPTVAVAPSVEPAKALPPGPAVAAALPPAIPTAIPTAAPPTAALPATAAPAAVPSPEQRLSAAQTALAAGDYRAAIDLARGLEQSDPDLPGLDETLYRAYLGHGRTLLVANDLDGSGEAFEQALVYRPSDPAALEGQRQVTLARDWQRMEASWGTDDEAALVAAEAMFRLDPEYRGGQLRQKLYALLISKADRLNEAGDRDGAYAVLTRALEVEPSGEEARQRLASYAPSVAAEPEPEPEQPLTGAGQSTVPAAQPQTASPSQPAPDSAPQQSPSRGRQPGAAPAWVAGRSAPRPMTPVSPVVHVPSPQWGGPPGDGPRR